MADQNLSKAALNTWCSRRKLKVNYEYGNSPEGFFCRITINDIPYQVKASGQNKRIASTKAALTFLQLLQKKQYLKSQEINEQCYQLLNLRQLLSSGDGGGSVEPLNSGDSKNMASANLPPYIRNTGPSDKNNSWWSTGTPFDQTTTSTATATKQDSSSSSSSRQPKQPQKNHQQQQHDYWSTKTPFDSTKMDMDNISEISDVPSSICTQRTASPSPSRSSRSNYQQQQPQYDSRGGGGGGNSSSSHQPYYGNGGGRRTTTGPGQRYFDTYPHRLAPEDLERRIPPPPSSFSGGGGGGGGTSQWRGGAEPYYRGGGGNGGAPSWRTSRIGGDHERYTYGSSQSNYNNRYNNDDYMDYTDYYDNNASMRNGLLSSSSKVTSKAMVLSNNNNNNNNNSQYSRLSGSGSGGIPPSSSSSSGRENHGFTEDNAKQLLHTFMQQHHIKADFKYDMTGPHHMRTFTASMRFFVPKTKKNVSVSVRAGSKAESSRRCALEILRQLHRDGLVGKFERDALSKRMLSRMDLVFDIGVADSLKKTLSVTYHTIQMYNSTINPTIYASTLPGPGQSLFANVHNPLAGTGPNHSANDSRPPDYLYWCPPMENFNPWTGREPDDAIYSTRSLDEVNTILFDQFNNMVRDPKFHELLQIRKALPIFVIKERLLALIRDNPVVIIKGSTGCGKTTQVPQFILDTFIRNKDGANCNIIVTQPRRISAISIAQRIAAERLEPMETNRSAVGYSVRFEHVYPRPYGSILFCTTGHLLRRIQTGLKGVSHLIIDEVHERDINTDLLLIIVRDLIRMNLNIKVIIMSATMGTDKFKRYFFDCHVLEIEGNIFPVHKFYLEDIIEKLKWWNPPQISYVDEVDVADAITASAGVKHYDGGGNRMDEDEMDEMEQLIHFDSTTAKNYAPQTVEMCQKLREGMICFELITAILEYIESISIHGAVLIFLPGWQSISALCRYLQAHRIFGDGRKFLILPLHSRLSMRENHRVFDKTMQRKIILSTNIAETSVTIDDVVFVIDSCLLKRRVFDSRNNVTSYIVDWVAKSNIQQRQGRAGRVQSGYFFGLCTKKRYSLLEEFKVPEILCTSLVETCLLIKFLGFGNVLDFLNNSLDPPSTREVQEALIVLRDINCFDATNQLTPLGSVLVQLPIDPRLGRMVLLAILLDVAGPAVTIAAACANAYELFDSSDFDSMLATLVQLDGERYSDHLILHRLYQIFLTEGRMHQYSAATNQTALTMVQNARRQMVDILTGSSIRFGGTGGSFPTDVFCTKSSYTEIQLDVVVGILVTAFYPNVCVYKQSRQITTNEGRAGIIHKTSVLYKYVQMHKLTKMTNLRSPLFVYSEKASNKNLISSKQMSMVSFLHLLLFGIRKYEFPVKNAGTAAAAAGSGSGSAAMDQQQQPGGGGGPSSSSSSFNTVLLDGWLEVRIDPDVFDTIFLIKTELENILTRVCYDRSTLRSLQPIEQSILDTVKSICRFDNVTFKVLLGGVGGGNGGGGGGGRW